MASTDETEPAHIRRARATLEAYVYRARRVEAHSLMREPAKVMKWAGASIDVAATAGEPLATFTWDLPPEELFESLATRCRPFILNGDPVHYSKVLNALNAFARADEEIAGIIKSCRADWSRVTQRKELLGFYTRIGKVGEDLGEAVLDVDSAHSWLYGDLVHADPPQDDDLSSIAHRYIAAVPIFIRIAMLAVATLNIVRLAEKRGLVLLGQDAHTADVVVEVPIVMQGRGVWAPLGTPVEDVEAAMDAWSEARPWPSEEPTTGV
ncbi:hypothetical protein [Nocardioides sp. KR10-350]|uniref:hypothetical protein n=1 Tax=Nocardioides cheoyonin TaxID=3156615 RepID=UPI0032B3D3A9